MQCPAHLMPPLQYATRPHAENMKHSRTNRIPIQGQKSLPSEFALAIQTLKGAGLETCLCDFLFQIHTFPKNVTHFQQFLQGHDPDQRREVIPKNLSTNITTEFAI